MYQHLDKPITLEQFEKMAKFELSYFLEGFECISYPLGKLYIESNTFPAVLELKIPEKLKLMVKLTDIKSGNELPKDNVIIQYDRSGLKAAVFVMIDTLNEQFSLRILANSIDKPNTYYDRASFVFTQIDSKPLLQIPRHDLSFGDKYDIECLSHLSVWIHDQSGNLILQKN